VIDIHAPYVRWEKKSVINVYGLGERVSEIHIKLLTVFAVGLVSEQIWSLKNA
jgi:hypothetical protein